MRHHPKYVERAIHLRHVERAASILVEESEGLRRMRHLVRDRVRVRAEGEPTSLG